MAPLELSYDVTLEDATEFALYHHAHSPHLLKRRRLMRLGMTALLVLIAGVFAGVTRSPLLGVVGFGFACLFWWIFPRRYERGLRETVTKMYGEGKNVGVLGQTKLIIDEEFLTEATPTRDVRTRWSAVEKVVDEKMHIYVYVTGSTALILPKRDLGDEATKQLLAQLTARVPRA